MPHDASATTQVLFVGTYHFHNPKLDGVKFEVADILSPEKQQEVADVTASLAAFQPNKIAVELPPEFAQELDQRLADYRAGRYALARSEAEQLGMRLAAQLDLPHVHPIDYMGAMPFQAVFDYAREHDPAFLAWIEHFIGSQSAQDNERHKTGSVRSLLRFQNTPEHRAEHHDVYLRFAPIGAGDSFVGANLLSAWYDRNIRIYANLCRIIEPSDRVLVVYGSGHVPILRELVGATEGMMLADPLDFL